MYNLKNQKINQSKIIEVLFYSFPVSFIIGNFVLSMHLLLFLVFALYFIKKEKLQIKFENFYWILIFFFLYLFLSTLIQFQTPGLLKDEIQDWPFTGNPIFKSFILLRFLILIIVLDTLFSNNKLEIKKFFFVSLICTSFVSFDIIFQYIMGFDIFGIKPLGEDRYPGPFGTENIAGSYLQKFCFFSFIYIIYIFKNKNVSNPLLIFFIVLHAVPLLLAGNRMSVILFLFGFFLMFLFIKKIRIAAISGGVIFSAIFVILLKDNVQLKNTYEYLFESINLFKPVDYVFRDSDVSTSERQLKKKSLILRTSGHGSLFRTSISMWKEQPIFGFGLKSFRIKCWEILPRINNRSCSTHSHNYYLELLSETGIVGTGLMILFFLFMLKRSFNFLRKKKDYGEGAILVIPLIIVIIIELWPIRSSGSFFTTWNATFFWLAASILLTTTKKRLD